MNPKRVVRQGIIQSLKPAKTVITKSTYIKRVVRNLVLEFMSLSNMVTDATSYQKWLLNNYPDAIRLFEKSREMQSFEYKPLISILTPIYNTDPGHLYECIRSVQAQLYQNWELCIVDDASSDASVRKQVEKLAATDKRIKYKFRQTNGHISKASNDALAMAKGEFVALLDHDDMLWPNALFEVVKALNSDKNLDFIYSDEEKIHRNRTDHQNPFFKPDWNPEFLESVNYITHFTVLRRSLVEKVGGFRSKYDGAQDWDLFLRLSQATKAIYHVPTVLYSWRMSATSTASQTAAKPYVREAQRLAIDRSLRDRGFPKARAVRGMAKDYWSVIYPVTGNPKVSIVIPTKNQTAIIKRCVRSIYKKTSYKNFEIIIVDTGSTDLRLTRWYKLMQRQHENLRVLDWPEKLFSYSRASNFGAQNATGEYLVMLNNDTEVITTNWLQLMLSDAQRDGIGAVGCKLYFPGSTRIQHAGIGIGFGGYAANSLSLLHRNELSPIQHLYANTRHQVSAVTAACLMIKKDRFLAVGGFDNELRITYNDVDLCLRLGAAGYRSIYNPAVELVHHESISVGRPGNKKVRDSAEFTAAKQLFKKRWGALIAKDPHLNPNIERDNALFEIKRS